MGFFGELLQMEFFKDLLRELDISDEDMPDLFDTFDVDTNGNLSILELLKGIRFLRGDPRRSDVVGVNLVVQDLHAMVKKMEKEMSTKFLSQQEQIRSLSTLIRAATPKSGT